MTHQTDAAPVITTNGKDSSVKRTRSKGFPVEPLPDAVAVLKESSGYGLRHTFESFAGFMGHKSTNSGPFKQKLASYREWGLISRSSDGVILTDLGKRIAMPVSENDQRSAIREAFFGCEVFNSIYDSSVKGQPLKLSMLANAAVQNHGISPTARKNFEKSFASSAVVAGVATRPDEQTIEFANNSQVDDLASVFGSRESDRHNEKLRDPTVIRTSSRPTAIYQSWPIEAGELILEIRSDNALPMTAYQKIAEVVEQLETLGAMLSNQEAPDAPN
jgi:hypothetical protein